MSDTANEQSQAMVRLVEPDENLKRLYKGSADVVMSFNPKTPAGAELLFKCTLDKLDPLNEQANAWLDVQHIFQHPAEKINENGEVQPFIRSVVITADGKAFDCGSEGVRKALALVEAVRGSAPWEPPIKCRVICTKTRSGKNWMILRPDTAELFRNELSPATQSPD